MGMRGYAWLLSFFVYGLSLVALSCPVQANVCKWEAFKSFFRKHPVALTALSDEQLQSQIFEIQTRWQNKTLSRRAEEKLYNLALEQYRRLASYDSLADLEAEGLLFATNNDTAIHSNYVFSSTQVGVLALKNSKNGTFKVKMNRGTPYFAGHEMELSLAGAGHSPLPHIQSPKVHKLMQANNLLNVIVAIPRDKIPVAHRNSTGELVLNPEILAQIEGVRVFKTTLTYAESRKQLRTRRRGSRRAGL